MRIPLEQELLLQTIFHPSEKADLAWQSWMKQFDIDLVTFDTYRLLPMVYKTLLARGVETPLMPMLKGIYKKNFMSTQLKFRRAALLFEQFQQQDIELVLLKGTAAVLQYYDDLGSRFMADVDVMLPYDRVLDALEICEAANWKVVEPGWGVEEGLREHHSIAVSSGTNAEVDLHWHLLHEYPHFDVDRLYLKNTTPTVFEGLSMRAPDPTYLFLHLCVNGLRAPATGSYWVIDVMRIGSAVKWDLDWERLISLSRKGCSIGYFRECLPYLVSEFAADIPERVINMAVQSKPRFIERLRVYNETHSVNMISGGFVFRLYEYLRANPERTVFGHIKGFPVYLKNYWKIDSWGRFFLSGVMTIFSVLARWITNPKSK